MTFLECDDKTYCLKTLSRLAKPLTKIKQKYELRYPNLILLVQWFSIVTMSSFWHLLPFHRNLFVVLSQCEKGNIELVKSGKKKNLFVTNRWFFCRTDSVQQTSSKETAKNAKKGDMIKIENHCTKKSRLGYFNCVYYFSLVQLNQIGHPQLDELWFFLDKHEHTIPPTIYIWCLSACLPVCFECLGQERDQSEDLKVSTTFVSITQWGDMKMSISAVWMPANVNICSVNTCNCQ